MIDFDSGPNPEEITAIARTLAISLGAVLALLIVVVMSKRSRR